MPNDNKNLVTEGTESFELKNLKDSSKDASNVVINIQDDSPINTLTYEDIRGEEVNSWYEKANGYLVTHSKIPVIVKSNFFHLLSVMINAGIPMVRALRSLAAQESNAKMQIIVHGLADQIENGQSLSEALSISGDVFLDQEIGMVQSGEASGQLNRVLENIAKDLEKEAFIRGRIKSAMMYPMIIMIILILVISGMMIFVIPKMTEMFSNGAIELPTATKIVIAVSDFMVNQKLLLVLVVVAVWLFFHLFKKTDIGRFTLDKVTLKMPIFGKLFMKAYLARFARSLSNLLDSNISIVKTIEITATSIGNEIYKRRLLLAMEDIKQGIPLAENLTDSDLFPSMLVNMVDVGEKTAQLGEITAKVADFYESEVDTAVAGISKIIEPIILVVMGLSVGLLVAAVMLPIMKLTDVAGTL